MIASSPPRKDLPYQCHKVHTDSYFSHVTLQNIFVCVPHDETFRSLPYLALQAAQHQRQGGLEPNGGCGQQGTWCASVMTPPDLVSALDPDQAGEAAAHCPALQHPNGVSPIHNTELARTAKGKLPSSQIEH